MDTTHPPPSDPRAELRSRAQELQARLGYVQLQLDALQAEKRGLVQALRTGEQVYAALTPPAALAEPDGGPEA